MSKKCITKLELGTLEADILLEFLYTVGFAIIAAVSNRVGKFPILCNWLFSSIIYSIDVRLNCLILQNSLVSIVVLLAGCGVGGLVVMFTDIPIVQILGFVILMCPGMAGNVLSSAAVEFYPTSLR